MKVITVIVRVLLFPVPILTRTIMRRQASFGTVAEGATLCLRLKRWLRKGILLREAVVGSDDALELLRAGQHVEEIHRASGGSRRGRQRLLGLTALIDRQIYSVYFIMLALDIGICHGDPFDPSTFLSVLTWHKLLLVAVAFELPVVAFLLVAAIRCRRVGAVLAGLSVLVEWTVRKVLAYGMPFGGLMCLGEFESFFYRIGSTLRVHKSPVVSATSVQSERVLMEPSRAAGESIDSNNVMEPESGSKQKGS